MPETRVTLQQALTAFRRLKQRTTEAIRSNSRMAWRCSGNTNEELVRNLERGGIFSSARVREAMLATDRGDFAPRSPYMDQPQGIGWNATISAPHMFTDELKSIRFTAGEMCQRCPNLQLDYDIVCEVTYRFAL
ncbi:hypothetical protein Y032_0075g974 [Ancylostoma ceylanicum]|nr:hypothetical protein Y032_0075g974 [Ancylostoma ceylanicum]